MLLLLILLNCITSNANATSNTNVIASNTNVTSNTQVVASKLSSSTVTSQSSIAATTISHDSESNELDSSFMEISSTTREYECETTWGDGVTIKNDDDDIYNNNTCDEARENGIDVPSPSNATKTFVTAAKRRRTDDKN